MKRVVKLTILAVLAGIFTANANKVQDLKRSLPVTDTMSGGRIVLNETGSAGDILNREDPDAARAMIKGYRVTIFFDNKQDSREKSEAAVQRFKASFPDIMVYTAYEIPYFRVMVGNCLNKEEALILQGRVKNVFPNAFIFNIDIPIKEFTKRPHIEPGDEAEEEADDEDVEKTEEDAASDPT